MLAAWFWLCNDGKLLLCILTAAFLHEVGHLLTLYAVGGRLFHLRIGVLGAVMETDCERLSYGRELAVLLAGPGANLLAAIGTACFWGKRGTVWIGVNAVLCLFNLLPLPKLDGGQAMRLLVTWMAGPAAGDWASRYLGTVCAVGLAAFLGWLMLESRGSLWLLPVMSSLFCTIWYLWRDERR